MNHESVQQSQERFCVVGASGLRAEEPWRKHVVHEGRHTNTAVAGDFPRTASRTLSATAAAKRAVRCAGLEGDDSAEGTDTISSIASVLMWMATATSIGSAHGISRAGSFGSSNLRSRCSTMDVAPGGRPGERSSRTLQGRYRRRRPARSDRQQRAAASAISEFGGLASRAQSTACSRAVGAVYFCRQGRTGLSHYFGVGDVNGDGRPDISLAAKGGPQAEAKSGEWFAWWEAPADAPSLGRNG